MGRSFPHAALAPRCCQVNLRIVVLQAPRHTVVASGSEGTILGTAKMNPNHSGGGTDRASASLGLKPRRQHRPRVCGGQGRSVGRTGDEGCATRPVALTLVKTFDQLYAELTDKAATRPQGSGTVAALDAGVHAIGKKIVEEAAEVWMAAEHEGKERTAEEISQLLYHLQVLMLAADISLDDVYAHL